MLILSGLSLTSYEEINEDLINSLVPRRYSSGNNPFWPASEHNMKIRKPRNLLTALENGEQSRNDNQCQDIIKVEFGIQGKPSFFILSCCALVWCEELCFFFKLTVLN